MLRAYDAQDRLISPHRMFRKAGDEAIALDQICRALHVQNCVLQGVGNNWIFLNVSPALILKAILPAPSCRACSSATAYRRIVWWSRSWRPRPTTRRIWPAACDFARSRLPGRNRRFRRR